MRIALKVAMLAQGHSQRLVAKQCGIHENRLSAIVRGWVDPREDERLAIAKTLGKSAADLFESEAEHAAEPAPAA